MVINYISGRLWHHLRESYSVVLAINCFFKMCKNDTAITFFHFLVDIFLAKLDDNVYIYKLNNDHK